MLKIVDHRGSFIVDKFVIALDPGIKYVGLAYGTYDNCRAHQLDLHTGLDSPLSISEQHWDIIEHINFWRDSTNSCEIIIETPWDLSDLDETDRSYENLSKLKIVCDELQLKLYSLSEGDKKYSFSTHDGATTKERRKELKINKSKDKWRKSITAHINDARALWSLGFQNRFSQYNKLPDIRKPKYRYYESWNRDLVEELLTSFKNKVINRDLRLLELDKDEEIDDKLKLLCSKRRVCKADILVEIERLTKIQKPKQSNCLWRKTRYSNVFHNTDCGKVLKYNSSITYCPSCKRKFTRVRSVSVTPSILA